MVSIYLINNYLVIRYTENFSVDPTTEFAMNSPMLPMPSSEMPQTCPNVSLNDIHKRGTEENKPMQTMCNNTSHESEQEQDPSAFYKRYKPCEIYDNVSDIVGSNYTMYNTNPNPYHLDYPLYDKNETPNTPQGVNYIK
jgi:hypothetical protein